MSVALYFYTLRHLKPIQFANRLSRRFRAISIRPPQTHGRRDLPGCWTSTCIYPQKFTKDGKFRFLNEERSVTCKDEWNIPSHDKLWLYNLHYFEDLLAFDAMTRPAFHRQLIDRWILENPARSGNGWEPYPLSLRIVNWIKWFLNGSDIEPQWLESLALQSHVLRQSLEFHLLGNHLFANGKALVFAGVYLDCEESDRWIREGLRILDEQIPEQILPDGGNFELSTMYHNIMLHDMLDLINLCDVSKHAALLNRVSSWRLIAAKMLKWMQAMLHPDGEISFFNDSAMGVAPAPGSLLEYADSLGVLSKERLGHISEPDVQLEAFRDSGYYVLKGSKFKAMLDCASVGPDYIPGHAHADTLSFELSVYGQRVFVNSGTSCYGVGDERLRQRQTAAHNTVEVDRKSSSEVWGGFRVARRAYPGKVHIDSSRDVEIRCSHDGYKRLSGGSTHSRKWAFAANSMIVEDHVTGSFGSAVAYYHVHPALETSLDGNTVMLLLPNGKALRVEVEGGSIGLTDTTWHPEFGRVIKNKKISISFDVSEVKVTISWD